MLLIVYLSCLLLFPKNITSQQLPCGGQINVANNESTFIGNTLLLDTLSTYNCSWTFKTDVANILRGRCTLRIPFVSKYYVATYLHKLN